MPSPPETCPNCGADVPPDAKACPECGADERTGWSEEAASSGLDLPDEEFDYDDFVKREFGKENEVKPSGLSWFWWVAAIITLLAVVLMFV
ncbi:MAG: zinc-ribbon domain-containing protein [Verrucomicrobiota bacterium]